MEQNISLDILLYLDKQGNITSQTHLQKQICQIPQGLGIRNVLGWNLRSFINEAPGFRVLNALVGIPHNS